jgi:hypothetical protein
MTSIKEHIRNVEKVVEKLKRKNKGKNFTSITPDEIERALIRANTPWILGMGYNTSVPQGGVFNCSVTVYNPGTYGVGNLYVHMWISSGIVDLTANKALMNVDARFGRLTLPDYHGLVINADSPSPDLNFALNIPATVEKSTYFFCLCLMQRTNHRELMGILDQSTMAFDVV